MRRILLASLAAFGLAMHGAAAEETVKIGAIGPFSGPAASSGIAMQKAWQYVVQQVNDAGGIEVDGHKRKIEMLFEDSQSRPEVGISAAQKLLTRDDVDILVGELFHSSVTLAIMELVPSFPNKVFYTGQPVSGEIAKRVAADPKSFVNFWKFSFNSDAYADSAFGAIDQIVADGKLKLSGKTIDFLAEDSDYGRSNVEAMRPLFVKAGWTVPDVEYVPMGTTDFFPQLTKMKQAAPGVLLSIFTSPASGAAVVKQTREQSLTSTNFAVFYPTVTEFRSAAGSAAMGLIYAPLLFDPQHNPAHKALADAMTKFLGRPTSPDDAFGYCNAALMMDAIRRAGSVQVEKLDAAMAATDFKCALGRWVFNPANHSPRIGAEYFEVPAAQIQAGGDQVFWPAAAATASYQPIAP